MQILLQWAEFASFVVDVEKVLHLRKFLRQLLQQESAISKLVAIGNVAFQRYHALNIKISRKEASFEYISVVPIFALQTLVQIHFLNICTIVKDELVYVRPVLGRARYLKFGEHLRDVHLKTLLYLAKTT